MSYRYQIYDFDLKRYYTLERDNHGWGFFKNKAYLFDTEAEALERIKFMTVFSTNDYRVLKVRDGRAKVNR